MLERGGSEDKHVCDDEQQQDLGLLVGLTLTGRESTEGGAVRSHSFLSPAPPSKAETPVG